MPAPSSALTNRAAGAKLHPDPWATHSAEGVTRWGEHCEKRSSEVNACINLRAISQWEVILVAEGAAWFNELVASDSASADQVEDAIDTLASVGLTLGRPLVDRIKDSDQHHLKELRPGSTGSSEMRILFAFDPVRRAVLLVAGDKAGNWGGWYDINIPIAEKRYRAHIVALDSREYE